MTTTNNAQWSRINDCRSCQFSACCSFRWILSQTRIINLTGQVRRSKVLHKVQWTPKGMDEFQDGSKQEQVHVTNWNWLWQAADGIVSTTANYTRKYCVNGIPLFKLDVSHQSLLKSAVRLLFHGPPCLHPIITGPTETRRSCLLYNSPTMDFDGQCLLSITVYR